MNIHNARFEMSAAKLEQCPESDMPEIAFVGRSNVGKSSLINSLLNRKKIAKVSSTPGKTALINFFNIDDTIHIVDLPGYGFASVSHSEKLKWSAMIENYLSKRKNLVGIVQLVDSRHAPSKDDITMFNWIHQADYRSIIVATKLDKLRKSDIECNLEMIYRSLNLTEQDVLIPYSSKTNETRDELWNIIKNECNCTQ